ncbi:MAG: PepSY domain-containing protein [Caulobacteraceae bacterium]
MVKVPLKEPREDDMLLRWALQLHKWIALAVGIQVLGWVLGGLIMTALPIEKVRSEQHIAQVRPAELDFAHVLPAAKVIQLAGLSGVTEASLKSTPRGPIWNLAEGPGGEAYFDAVTGQNIDEITQAQARQYAIAAYKGAGHAAKLVYHEEAPVEAGTSGAVYQMEFDDPERTSFYLSAYTGEVLSRRSNVWRFYNFFYQIHIMNFSGNQNYNHPTIVTVTAFTLTVVLTGFVLLWIRIARDLQGLKRRRDAAA